jgi:class 3 adenylate cyclase
MSRPHGDTTLDTHANSLEELQSAHDQLTRELKEALDREAATADILRVISSSPTDTQPVFDAIVQSGSKLFPDAAISVALPIDGEVHAVAVAESDAARAEAWRQRFPFPLTREYMHGIAILEGRVVDLPDVANATDDFKSGAPNFLASGYRAVTMMPLMRGDGAIGVLSVVRLAIGPLSKEQLAVLRTFAAQAVIAIENTRMVNELRKSTEELQQSYKLVQSQADQLREQSDELRALNQQLEQRVADQVAEIERMSRLRRFLPPQVADLIVSSGAEAQLESHRSEITALFCDLRGFTGFAESADPEDVMVLLREYHAAIGKIIHDYGGTLERFAGDGVMVIFNDPVPVPDPALQAVKMALEMRASIGTLVEKWQRMGHELGFGIGISHGYATLGTIGFEGRFDYAAIGTVANVASRLCDEATSGQILISARVQMAVEDAVTVEPAGELTLKGIRRPVAVYNVLDAAAPSD